MKENRKQIKKLIAIVLIIVVIMVTGVIVLAHNNDIFKPTYPAKWKVEFTSIAEGKIVGNAKSRYLPQHTATHAWFYVDFVTPGDSITYDLQISNRGTLNSYLADIDVITNFYNDAIKYEIDGIKVGNRINPGKSKNFEVTITYDLHAEEAIEFDKPISILFDFRQAY